MGKRIEYWTIGSDANGDVVLNINLNDEWYELHVHEKDVKSMTNQIMIKPLIQRKKIEEMTLKMYKVFEFADCDWIAAKNEEEAKVFYEQYLPREEVEECFEGEVSLDEHMVIDKAELTESEIDRAISVLGSISEEGSFRVTLRDWLRVLSPIDAPFIIASTEH
jgi:hypothetical protein